MLAENPSNITINKAIRAGMNISSGAIPLAGGILAAASAAWSEHEQDQVNKFLKYRQQLLDNEVKEQLQ